MDSKSFWEDRYVKGFTPWDTKNPDHNLINTIKKLAIDPCKVLDIGCGTGTNSIWLAENGFQVLGIDITETSISLAKSKSIPAGAACEFITCDFLKEAVPGTPFDFAFDRGCFHIFDLPEERLLFAQKVAENLAENGLWLSLVGSPKGRAKGSPGPPTRTKLEIVEAVEPFFEILSLADGHFAEKDGEPMPNWVCLMKKM